MATEQEIFFEALEMATPELRNAYLLGVCGRDVMLRRKVDELLKEHFSNDTLLCGPAVEADRPTFPSVSPSEEAPTQMLGRYKLLEKIGEGGFGEVWMAEQRVPVKRRVALKIIKLGMDSRQIVARFEAERQALAMMDHPNIARIFDADVTDSGRPYFVMELVRGIRITDYCDQNGLSTRKRLDLFVEVCQAIQHAHQKGIIHRDIKPSNILITVNDGVAVPKVIDFGIAKATQGELTDKTVFTQFQQFIGTPAYISPEQAEMSSVDIDTRADIYSLGVLLYELLVGQTPFDAKEMMQGGLDALRQIVREREPQRPSTRLNTLADDARTTAGKRRQTDAVKLVHQLQGDLDWIVMKCLEKDRTRRYDTANGLAMDIQRHLGCEPILARPPSKLYEFQKSVRRHKFGFAAAAALILVLALGITLTAWQAVRATQAKKQATGEAARAEQEAIRARSAELKATTEAERATTAEQAAKTAEAAAVQERETARQALAKSQLDLAEKEFERGKFSEARKILMETPESFRDANWRFLAAHSRDFTAGLSPIRKGGAKRLTVLPPGDRFAARYWDGKNGTIGIFSLTGRQIGDWIPVGGVEISAFGINNDGSRLAFAAEINEVAVWDVANGQFVRRWTSEISKITHVLLSPDGGTVLAAGGKQLIAYAAETGALLWTQPFHDALPDFSPDGRTVAILTAKDGVALKIQLLDPVTGAVRSTLEASADNPEKTTLQFNQTGDRLACLGGDEVILWNPQTAAKIRALHFPGEQAHRLSPDGNAVATVRGSRIRLWDATTGGLLRSFNGADADVFSLAFSPDGKVLLSAHISGADAIVNIWPTRLGEAVASASAGSQGRRVLFDRDASRFYTSAREEARGWETRSGLPRWQFATTSNRLLDLEIHPTDGSIIMSEARNPTFTHQSSAGEALEAFGSNEFASLKFNRGGQLLLTVVDAFAKENPGRGFIVLEYPSGNVLRKVPLENPGQPFATFCLDDAAVATAALAGGITVWDWKAGTPLRQIAAAETGSIACLASSPDGRHLATGGPDRWIRVWEAATGRLETAFRAHWEGVRCVKFSPDGRELLSGSEDGTMRIHDAGTGEEKLAFYGLTKPVADVDISPDGTHIAAITTEAVVKVWDRQSSSAAALLPRRPRPAVAKDADGWEDLFAQLTPALVEETGQGWSLRDGELFSPDTKCATLRLPGEVSSGTSYQVRVKLRQLPAKESFSLFLPVADRMVAFNLDGVPQAGYCTGLNLVNGKRGKDLPGVLEGKQVKDSEPHDLEVTVRLDGANVTITTTLDTLPLYKWTGPTAALSQGKAWPTIEPGTLALGTYLGGWAVSGVKVKRLEEKKPKL